MICEIFPGSCPMKPGGNQLRSRVKAEREPSHELLFELCRAAALPSGTRRFWGLHDNLIIATGHRADRNHGPILPVGNNGEGLTRTRCERERSLSSLSSILSSPQVSLQIASPMYSSHTSHTTKGQTFKLYQICTALGGHEPGVRQFRPSSSAQPSLPPRGGDPK